MQYSVISTGMSLFLWVRSPHLWFFSCKTAHFMDQNFKSLWVPALICGFWMQTQQRVLAQELQVSYGSQTFTCPCVQCKTAWLYYHESASLYWFQPSSVVLCLQNSDFRTRITSLCGSQDPTCGFLHSKQRASGHQNIQVSVRVPDMTFRFVHVPTATD